MRKKSILLISFAVVLALAGNGLADTISWDNEDGTNLWKDPNNWDPNQVPTAADEARIGETGGVAGYNFRCEIGPGVAATCSRLYGPGDTLPAPSYLYITGGSFDANNGWFMGNSEDANGIAHISGGDVTVNGAWRLGSSTGSYYAAATISGDANVALIGDNGHLWLSRNGNSRLTISDGKVSAGGQLRLGRGGSSSPAVATVNISGGTVDISSGIVIAKHPYNNGSILRISGGDVSCGSIALGFNSNWPGSKGELEMTGGTLDISGNFSVGDAKDCTGYANLQGGTINIDGIFTRDVAGITRVDVNDNATIIMTGNTLANIGKWLANNWLRYGGWDLAKGDANDDRHFVCDYDVRNAGKTTITTIPASQIDFAIAYDPSPWDGAKSVDPNVVLSWMPGDWAADVNGHDVYLGADFNDVNDANATITFGVYRGRYDPNSYDPGTLEFGQTYYWRIDEVNDTCSPPSPWKGVVWSFTVRPKIVLMIVSWNIEFLGKRDPLRTQEQIDAIAQRILTFDAAILTLQEITIVSVLQDIRGRLGASWQIYHSGGNENALLYDENKVEMLSVEILENLSEPPNSPYPGASHRKPVSGVFRPVKMYAGPFRVMGVHCHWSDADIRASEGTWLRTRIIEFLEDPTEPNEIILAGDLNGAPGSPPHPQLQEGGVLHLLPKENGNSTHVGGGQIDHCYVTQAAKDKLPKQSTFVIRPEHYRETPEEFDATYSDHYPIFIDFRPDPCTDLVDFAMFAAHWLETGCNLQNNWCDRADLDGDGDVGFNDLKKLVDNWPEGTVP